MKLIFQQGDKFSKVSDEVLFFNFLRRLACGYKFLIFHDNKLFLESGLPEGQDLTKYAEKHLDNFEKLKRVELAYNIRFTNLTTNSFNNQTYFHLLMVIDALEGVATDYIWQDQLSFKITERTPKVIELLKSIESQDFPVTNQNSERTIVDLHGQKIDIGYQIIEYLNPYVANLDEVLNGNNDEVFVKSRSELMKISHIKAHPINED